jgi:eukaryotic-like serine/threonine-protein kinase
LNSSNKHKAQDLADRLLDYPESEWNRLIDLWCGRDIKLKGEVQFLAEKNCNARDFVEEFQEKLFALTKTSLTNSEFEPVHINGYQFLKKLGSGGSAAVYLAENSQGHKVAIKVLRRATASADSRHRFESTHQILAGLNHPNIANFIEGGVSDDGTPYLIMEYVDGIPIDAWCKRNQLGVSERIQLFQTVCRAVHYAHQNLVVHRDIKPEHVLVTPGGEIKLIDFGIAKLLEPALPETATLKTHTGLRIMTPEFASPEQVRGESVTTASDIYSLGILLYLLLTGHRPYEFKSSSMLEIERVVCETEPLKPSDAVIKPNHSKQIEITGTDLPYSPVKVQSRLRKILTGDLDRIVMMAMGKEPSHRYASALALKDDLTNYLRGEPVTARPPTWRYRTRKFVTRNKWSVTAAVVSLILLAGGLISTIWQARVAEMNAQRAEAQALIAGQVTDFLIDLFEANDPGVIQGEQVTIEELLEKGVEQALTSDHHSDVRVKLLSVLARVYSGMGFYDISAELYHSALDIAQDQYHADPLVLSEIQAGLGLNHRIMGNLFKADSLYREALDNRITALGELHPLTIQSMDDWAGIHAYLARDAILADSLFQEVVNRRRSSPESDDRALAESLNNLAYIKMTRGETHNAQRFYEESAELYKITLGEYHPDRLRTLSSLAVAYQRTGNYGRSEQLFNYLIEANRQVLGNHHPQLAITYHHLSQLLKDTGRLEQALSTIRTSYEIMQNLEAPHQFFPDILFSYADLNELTGRVSDAVEFYHLTAQNCMEIRGIDSPGCTKIYQAVGSFFIRQNQKEDARVYLIHAYNSLVQRLEPDNKQLLEIENLIALTE